MKREARLVLWFVLFPFLISGAFWLSPWAGWPALVVLGLLWLGVCISIGKLE